VSSKTLSNTLYTKLTIGLPVFTPSSNIMADSDELFVHPEQPVFQDEGDDIYEGETMTEDVDPPVDVDTQSGRQGTTASARFNILSTMVGGGSLSLPMAFQKAGNALFGPLLLFLTAVITEFCFRTLVNSARFLSPVSNYETRPGKDSFESIASAAFGNKAYLLSKILVTAMCFFGTVAYAVLLRDMLQPISDKLFSSNTPGPTWANNLVMASVVLLVTPLCTLKTLTSLERFGALSMLSVLVLGSCVVFRSIQCYANLHHDANSATETKSFRLFPESMRDLLNVFPIFVSCFVCHYNIPTVHNELRNPSPARVGWWLRSTTWSACLFYMILGVAGSAYGPCSNSGVIHGNILLDFDDQDPLLLVGRMCLALTITLAFPMLTIPARDILIRSIPEELPPSLSRIFHSGDVDPLEERLIDDPTEDQPDRDLVSASTITSRLLLSVSVLWTATMVASCVESIENVWDLLGSSLSILMSYLIPCGSFLVIMKQREQVLSREDETPSLSQRMSIIAAWSILGVFMPMMFVSTGNAVHQVLFTHGGT